MLIVQKFGGSSVGTLERIRACAQRCLDAQRQGNDLVVVVSAMAGETNRLIKLANRLRALGRAEEEGEGKGPYVAVDGAGDPVHERELDQLVSTGENVSAALLAMAIHDLGGEAISLVGHQIGMITDRTYTNARIKELRGDRIRREIEAGKIVVCAGFQGLDADGNITTLGRGGSDTSAVALAAAIGADVCEIYTDVDGVYTTDPRIEPKARKIAEITCEEMLELASLGAKVLQIRSVAFAMKYGVAVHVRSSLNNNEGTWIVSEYRSMEAPVVVGLALDRNEAKVTLTNVPDVPGVAAMVFNRLAEAGVVVDMIIQNASRDGTTDLTFTVPENDLERSVKELESLDLPRREALTIVSDPEICKISIVGVGMRSHSGVAAKAFQILAAEGINIHMVSTSEIKVSVVVQERYGELALRALHAGFGLDEGPSAETSKAS
ncbi:MAG: aspartate kinase [Myxococcales bacterium]|nr:aspartate kinase [Myxococcales bacterium]